tara:strand:- start:562336 stop:563613 length:1278 start_codon:yes stop_codon:yes gene_type:complete
MDNIAYQFNRLLLFMIVIAPILGFITIRFIDIDLFMLLQFFSFIGIFLLLIFRTNARPIIFPKYILFYLLFILYVFYSAFFILDRDFKINYLFSNRLVGALNFMLIIENVPISKKQYQLLIKSSIAILIFAFVVIVIQEVVDPSFFLSNKFERADLIAEGDTENRLMSIYSWIGELNEIGFGFVPVFILITEHFLQQKKKIFLWMLMGMVFILLSKARWVMLNGLVVFVLLIINSENKIGQVVKYAFLIPLLSIVIFFGLKYVGLNVEGIVNERILEKNDKGSEKSATTRFLAFDAFNKLYWENAFWGKGSIKYGMGGTGQQDYQLKKFLNGRSAQIHVGYLSLFYMYGLVGGFFFMAFLTLFMRKIYKQAKMMRFWAPFLGFLGLVLANLTLVTFSTFQVGLLTVLIAHNYYYQNFMKSTNNVL